MSKAISKLTAAPALDGTELIEISRLSDTVTITASTISADGDDNSFNDSGNGFVAAGFAAGMRVQVVGFTGNVANNIYSATVTVAAAGKLTIGGTDGDVIVDDAAGESVSITAWETRRATLSDVGDLAGGSGSGGIQSIPILAAAMVSSTTNGAEDGTTETTTNDVMLATKDFDQSTQEHVQFMFPMPKSWDELTIIAQFIWTADSGTGNVIWGIQAVALSEGDAIDTAWGTAEEVTDGLTTAGDQHTSSWTDPITVGASPVEGDLVAFRIYRKAADGSDTLDADARLIAIRLNITTNAADDS